MVRNGMVSAYNIYNHLDYTVRATPTETSTCPSYYFGNVQDSTRFQYTWIEPIRIVISKKPHVQNNFKILSPYLVTMENTDGEYNVQQVMSSCKFFYFIYYLLNSLLINPPKKKISYSLAIVERHKLCL